MNTIFKQTYLAALFAALMLASCSDFLKEEDKDKVIPRTLEQFEAMLHQKGFAEATWFYASEFMTDDVSENARIITSAKNRYKEIYTWQYDIERTGDGEFSDENNDMWRRLYNNILVANYILECSPNITGKEATVSAISQLDAEAHFLRARAYLELVNIYAEPYDSTTAATVPGVPLREGTGVTNNYKRNTVAEVYEQIEKDLNEAISLFDASKDSKSLWHPNKKAALLLLARTYLYKEEWQKVVNTTTTLINLCPGGLYALNRNIIDPMVRTANTEVLHTYGVIAGTLVDNQSEGVLSDIPKIYRVEGSMSNAAYGVSDELLNMYSENDLRPLVYFMSASGKTIPAKWHPVFTKLGGYTYRLAEAFLARAEANAALNHTEEALADIVKLLSKRIDGDFEALLPDASDQLAVRRFVLDQRRLELCFENQRWFDLRRSQSWYPKDIEHTFSLSSSQSGYVGTIDEVRNYTLKSTSANYTLELPRAETDINPDIERFGKREVINAN